MVRVSAKIRRVLIDAGLVTSEAWAEARDQGGNILNSLVRRDQVEEGALLEALGCAAGIPPLDLTHVDPDPAAVERLPQASCQEFGIVPVSLNGKILTIAVSDPFDVMMLDDLCRRANCMVRQVVSHPAAIQGAIDRIYHASSKQVDELLESVGDSDFEVKVQKESEEIGDLNDASGDDAPAVKLINMILLRGLKEKASDIHIEPAERNFVVRYRIDGRLKIVMSPPKKLLNSVISRLKILAQLNIAERYTPQDGKFQIRFEGRSVDFRVSILPVVGGEKGVLRILDGSGMALRLDSMGYEDKALSDIKRAVSSPYGMMLVTGPTGSGKTTTLYSCVKELTCPEVNIVTVEDPVEYFMDSVNQVAVNVKRGMTFAGALRSILRQDPDIVLVGEIRDTETADIAIKAALTGHLVLSTVHTNDACSTVTRLVDMGVDPFMVSSSLLCVGAQRLARKLCENCRVPLDTPPPEYLLSVGFRESEINDLQLYQAHPDGCPRCNRGFSGRFAVLETLFLDENLKRMVVTNRSVHELKAEAVSQGMLTLRRVGIRNAILGRTSLEEILRVTLED